MSLRFGDVTRCLSRTGQYDSDYGVRLWRKTFEIRSTTPKMNPRYFKDRDGVGYIATNTTGRPDGDEMQRAVDHQQRTFYRVWPKLEGQAKAARESGKKGVDVLADYFKMQDNELADHFVPRVNKEETI